MAHRGNHLPFYHWGIASRWITTTTQCLLHFHCLPTHRSQRSRHTLASLREDTQRPASRNYQHFQTIVFSPPAWEGGLEGANILAIRCWRLLVHDLDSGSCTPTAWSLLRPHVRRRTCGGGGGKVGSVSTCRAIMIPCVDRVGDSELYIFPSLL